MMGDFLDHDSSEKPVVVQSEIIQDTAQNTADIQQQSSVSHFENAVSFLDSGKSNKITFYLSDGEVQILETAMLKHSVKRNTAMKLAIAALKDRLEPTSTPA